MKALNTATTRLLFALVLPVAGSGTAHAITGCNQCTVSAPPFSQLGPINDQLICQFTGTDIIMTGDVTVTVAAGYQAGLLADWTVECTLPSPLANASTTTTLDGFVAFTPVGPTPPSTFQPTKAKVESSVLVGSTTVAGSVSPVDAWLDATGADNPKWIPTNPQMTAVSGSFSSPPGAKLKQRFVIDGVQLTGPGGAWKVDVPLRSSVAQAAPAPILSAWGWAALVTLLLGSGAALHRGRRGSAFRG